MRPNAFIFDMDGVIADSNPYHEIALRQFSEQHGFRLTEDDLRNTIFGRTNKDWIPQLFGTTDANKIAEYAAEKEALYRELYAPHIQPVDGLIAFLDKLKALGIPRAIATSAPRENVDFTLEKTGTQSYFDVILDESFVTRGKPDPEIYLKTAEALNLPPAQCVVFEDSISGVLSAKAAGCRVIGITTTHSKDEFPPVDRVIDDFQGLEPRQLLAELQTEG
ncbi:MAG TPA: HAD family phosphatase [Cyclobacteriaceae bacterium]|nr:HAD family phosphatase [Cyclobacteriaceae bacterium]